MLKKLALFLLIAIQIQAAMPQNKSDLVASVLILEAQNQGEIGMKSVLEVLRNRAKSSEIDKIYLEAKRPKQFSCLNNISESNAIAKARKSSAWRMATKLVQSKSSSNLVCGARHYYAAWLKSPPPWAAKVKRKIQIGDHIFCILD